MNTAIENKKNEVKNNVKKLFESFEKEAKTTLAVCPKWEVLNVDIYAVGSDVTLLLKESKEVKMKISYKKGRGNIKESFETNVSAYGSFNPLTDNVISNYYTSVADIIQHKDMLTMLKNIMQASIDCLAAYYKEYETLESQEEV